MEDLSMDLKKRVAELRKKGERSADVAQRLLVSLRSVQRIWKHWQDCQEVLPSRRKGKGETLLVGHEGALKVWIEQRPAVTLEELAEMLREQKQVQASPATIWRKLQAMGLRHKKNGFRGRAGPS